jgi:hypothetical protein
MLSLKKLIIFSAIGKRNNGKINNFVKNSTFSAQSRINPQRSAKVN